VDEDEAEAEVEDHPRLADEGVEEVDTASDKDKTINQQGVVGLGEGGALDKRSGNPRHGDEPRAEGIPAEMAPGDVIRRVELVAAVGGVEGVGDGSAGELAPVHDHDDARGAAFVSELGGVGEGVEEGGDEDAEGEVVECLQSHHLRAL
jgi:hypothetical protein